MQADIDKLWQLAYKSFNRSHEAFEIAGIVGGASASKEVGHRLMDHISQLRQNGVSQSTVDSINGDIMIAEAGGWIANDTAAQMLDLLEAIQQGRGK